MYRSIVRVLSVAAVAAALPAMLHAQTTCLRNAGVNTGTCNINATFTIPALAGVTTGASSTAFVITNTNWENLMSASATVMFVAPDVSILFRANTNVGVSIQAGTLARANPTGTSTRDNTDYGYDFATTASTCSATPGDYVAFTGAAQDVKGATQANLPASAFSITRFLCINARFDPTVPEKLAPGDYTLPVAFVLAAP